MPRPHPAHRPLATLGAALCLLAAPAFGQAVSKCETGGRTVYQAEPCTGGRASAVKIAAAPSDEDVQAARQRADREKMAAASIRPATPPARRGGQALPAPRGMKINCDTLGANREKAYSRRNAALAGARRGAGVTAGSTQDLAIRDMQIEVVSIDLQLRSRGCATP